MFDDLLPLSAEAPRCNDFARSLGVRPLGTGLFLNRIILVSVPLPWPKPALKHPILGAAASHVMGSSIPSRLFAAEPFGDALHVEVYERTDNAVAATSYRWAVDDVAGVEPLAAAIGSAALGSLHELSVSDSVLVESGVPAPTFLVCTQGSHDLCCGTAGVALADEIEQQRPGYTVRRVSHTGGHRFSPTLMALPEGRMWAYVDLDLVDRIAQDRATADDFRTNARGWWGAKVGPTQVAEGVVRAELAEAPFALPIVAADESATDQDSRFTVLTGEQSFVVDVSVGRHVPSISCEAPGGLPAKPGREFAWSLERATTDAGLIESAGSST